MMKMSRHRLGCIPAICAALALSCTSAPARSSWFFDDMHAMFEQMDQMFERQLEFMHKMHGQGRQAVAKPLAQWKSGITAEIKDEADAVKVVVNGLRSETLDADLNDRNDELTITTKDGRITLTLDQSVRNYTGLAVSVRQERVDTREDDDKKQQSARSVCASSSFQWVTGSLSLEENGIEYDESAERLVVSIPKPAAPVGRKVTINVVNKKDAADLPSEAAEEKKDA